jgi:hypothetical protein
LNDLFGWFDPHGAVVDGDWDVSVRDLVRVLYLDELGGSRILDTAVHVSHDLINLDLPHAASDDYPWTACGNTENASGDAEERFGNEGFAKDAIDAVGDFWDWLRDHCYLTLGLVIGYGGIALASKPHRVRSFKLSSDRRFVEKLTDVVGLYFNPPEKAVVLCVDEKSQIRRWTVPNRACR